MPRPRSNLRISASDVGAVATVVAAKIALNRLVPRHLAVPGGLAAAGTMLALAKVVGVDFRHQGLAMETAPRGLLAGVAVGAPIAMAMSMGAYFPLTQNFFRDERIVSASPAQAAYHLLIRIPLGTALSEELIFRGALEGVLLRDRSVTAATLISAALFGAWHILPTYDRVHSNPGVAGAHGGNAVKQTAIVGAVVGATAAASVGLSWLRRRTGSVIAPVLVHTAINAGGFAGGWLAARGRSDVPRKCLGTEAKS